MSPDPEVLYVAMIGDPSRLRALRRLRYWCANERCLLLDAIEVADTIVLHQKRYKYSPAENADRSSESGRRANTYDGENHWKEHSYFIGTSALAHPEDDGLQYLGLHCDHIAEYALQPSEFDADLRDGHTEVRLRADGTRFVVV